MENKSSITALMSSFGRAFHAENEKAPVFGDTLAKELMTEEEKQLLNAYHQSVYEKISPYLEAEEKEWLKEYTRPVK